MTGMDSHSGNYDSLRYDTLTADPTAHERRR